MTEPLTSPTVVEVVEEPASNDDSGRISRMNQNMPKAYLKTVGLQNSENTVFCSGVIVSRYSVLTAAHCVCGEETISSVFVGRNVHQQFHNELSISLPVDGTPVLINEDFCSQRDRWKSNRAKVVYPKWDLAIIHLSEELPDQIAGFVLPAGIALQRRF